MLDTSSRSFLPLPSESSLDAMAARTNATKKVGEKMYNFRITIKHLQEAVHTWIWFLTMT